jgi:hypothetical protein
MPHQRMQALRFVFNVKTAMGTAPTHPLQLHQMIFDACMIVKMQA